MVATAIIKRLLAKNPVHAQIAALGDFEAAGVLLVAKSAGITKNVTATNSTASVTRICVGLAELMKSWTRQIATGRTFPEGDAPMFAFNAGYQSVPCSAIQT